VARTRNWQFGFDQHGGTSRRSYGRYGAALCRLAVSPPQTCQMSHFNGLPAVSPAVIVAKKVIKASASR
jgi:hypothetical protein